MNLEHDIADYLTNVMARPCKAEELIADVIKMAAVNSNWPKASCEQWQAAIESAIEHGKIVRVGLTLWLPKPERKVVQKNLF